MDLKNLLSDLGYSNEQVDAIANKKKVYFQDDVDNIVAKSKDTLIEKYSRNYVAKSDYDLIQSEYNTLLKDVKTREIKDEFIKMGGNEKYFDDYIKINSNLMDLTPQELSKSMKETTTKNTWAFNTKKPDVPFGYQDDPWTTDDGFDGETIYSKSWDKI